MHGYRDHCIRPAYPEANFYCPYSMGQVQCPYYSEYRQRPEEYPVQQQQQQPQSPPPSYTPKITNAAHPNLSNVTFKVISPCIFKMTYLWLKNGSAFWSYLVFINRRTASGWRYINGQWQRFNVSLREIKNFICS